MSETERNKTFGGVTFIVC